MSGLQGKRLKELRGDTTQVDLEFEMRQRYGRAPSRASIQNYEAGRTQPKAPDLALLADYFGVSVDFLLGRESPEQETPVSPEEAAAMTMDEGLRDLGKGVRRQPQVERRRGSRREADSPPRA